MKITILGATGPTGTLLLDQALAAGHEVTALVRNPDSLTRRHAHLRVVAGDATRAADLEAALTGSDAVLSALGSGKDRRSDVASRAARALVPAAAAAGVRRAIVLSAFGVGKSRHLAGAPHKLVMKLMMDTLFADKAVADDLVRSSPLDWTLVYPVTLGNGDSTRWTAADAPSVSMTAKVNRAAVADFMLAQIASTEWSRRTAILKGA